MKQAGLSTPVLFLIFKRPEVTRLVFEEIRRARPTSLFVVADGPRKDLPGEADLCEETRAIINVDWDCDLRTLFRSTNLGTRQGVSSAVTWFFQNVEEGIVLEDDCLPDPSFFSFAQELLARYRDDPRIMHISGDNFQSGRRRGDASYYFSRYPHCWGWASWRRAWALFNLKMTTFSRFASERQIVKTIKNGASQRYWTRALKLAYEQRVGCWDCAWAYAVISHRGLCAVPNENLVTNIGFGNDATHTREPDSRFACIPTTPMGPIIHPEVVADDDEADNFEVRHVLIPPLRLRLLNRLRRALGRCR
jgi:hypothetical protein